MASNARAPSGRIPSLDGLRGVAILMVLLSHGLQTMGLPPWLDRALGFAGNGPLGVGIFFVLSGFLIHGLSIEEIRRTGAFDVQQFYRRRILRIFPCFYFYIAVLLALMACGVVALSPAMLGSAASFSLNYRHLWDSPDGGPYDYAVIGHYWTLALEEQFYLTWPLLIALALRGRLLIVLLAVVVSAPLVRVASYFLALDSRGQLGMMFHTGFDSIAGGVLLGELLRRPWARALLERLASRRGVVAAALAFLFVLSPLLHRRWGGAYDLVFGQSAQIALVCLLIVAALSFPGTWLYRVLNWRPLAYIGVLSYSLYDFA